MKHILLLLTPCLSFIASCTSGQPEKEPLPEPGIYVSMIKTEQCNVADTLELKLLHTKRLYRVRRKIGLWITKQDTNECIRYNSTQWPAVYEENTHKLQGTDERPVIHYDPDNNTLTISGETYTKIDNHVSN